MTKPEDFILNTDFATLKGGELETFDISLPATTIPAGPALVIQQAKAVGVAKSSERVQISSSKTGRRYISAVVVISRVGSTPSLPIAGYDIVADISRTSPTQLTATIVVRNPYGQTLTTEAGTELFHFSVATFQPPFPT